ncbi:oligosaccharide flippase family protein [Fulvivirga sp.]|uniref:lipopolysaccharide biosynthesis protein n=1 Tax=Fulvivirga sp. TaxID=1931237 RepID=UPI0032EE72C3
MKFLKYLPLNQVLKKNSYSQNTALILLSKVLITLLVFITTPIIARFYSPEEYGTYALINSIVIIFSIVSTWSLSSEIVVAQSSDLRRLLSFIIQISVIGSIFLTIILYAVRGVIYNVLDIHLPDYYLIFVPVFVLIVILSESYSFLNIRDKLFKKNIVVNTSEVISNKITSLVLGFLGLTQFGLIIGDFIGKINNLLVQFFGIGNLGKQKFPLINLFNTRNLFIQGKKYSAYLKYQMPTILTRRISKQFIIWLLAIVFSKEELGHYTMAISLLTIPLNLFSNSFQPIITRKFSDIKTSPDRLRIFNHSVALISIISVTMYLGIFVLSEWVVSIYLGKDWNGAIKFIKLLSILFAATLLSNSISGAYIIFKQQKLNFLIKIVFSILLFVALILALNLNMSLVMIISIYVTISVAEELIRLVILRRKLQNINE